MAASSRVFLPGTQLDVEFMSYNATSSNKSSGLNPFPVVQWPPFPVFWPGVAQLKRPGLRTWGPTAAPKDSPSSAASRRHGCLFEYPFYPFHFGFKERPNESRQFWVPPYF